MVWQNLDEMKRVLYIYSSFGPLGNDSRDCSHAEKVRTAWGSFNNYVDMILSFFDHLPTPTWTFITLNVDQNWHFLTTYPPHLVHVVFQRPLVRLKPSISTFPKHYMRHCTRLLKCFVLQHSVIKTKYLRSRVRGVV